MAVRGRRDWLEAELRCLLCGRAWGRLVGCLPRGEASEVVTLQRAGEQGSPARPLARGEQFRCGTCGGRVIVDHVETFSTYDEEEEEPGSRPRRGRPPKPWRRLSNRRLHELGLAV
jgi:hypothetical protein